MKHSEVPRKWAFSASKTPEKFSRSDTHLCRFRTIRRLRTGGPTNGWALSHSSSSDSSVPGIANGLTLRSGRPWFFANRLIESSLSPKSLAISGSCNHRFVPIFRGIICQNFLSLDVTRISPKQDHERFGFGPGHVTLQRSQKIRFLFPP